jgi:hypothetical protein
MCGAVSFVLLALAALHQVDCYFEVDMTEGRAIRGVKNSIDFERVMKLNKTTFVVVGTIDVNAELDDT